MSLSPRFSCPALSTESPAEAWPLRMYLENARLLDRTDSGHAGSKRKVPEDGEPEPSLRLSFS